MSHPVWRKKTLFSVAACVLLGGILNKPAYADFQLLDSSQLQAENVRTGLNSYNSTPAPSNNSVSSGANSVKVTVTTERKDASGFGYVTGYGHEVKMEPVLKMYLPKTWVLRFKSAELKSYEIDYNVTNIQYYDLLQDLSDRYGLVFEVGRTSGVLSVGWKQQECKRHDDSKTLVIC